MPTQQAQAIEAAGAVGARDYGVPCRGLETLQIHLVGCLFMLYRGVGIVLLLHLIPHSFLAS